MTLTMLERKKGLAVVKELLRDRVIALEAWLVDA
jgi:hypothetical protein